MSAYDQLVERFGVPAIQCRSPADYRVQVPGWHLHDGAVMSCPTGDGESLDVACAALLRSIARPHVELVEGSCDWQCENRYDDSPKSKLAHENLMAFIRKTAAEVERWPAWKRGLPKCGTAGCNMAAGHAPPCGGE